MRKLLFFIAALALSLSALAQDVRTGYVTIVCGYRVDSFGNKIPLKGIQCPVTVTKIQPWQIGGKAKGGGDNQSHIATVYQADAGSGYGFVDPNPSSLDDLNLSGGAGLPWQNFTFGFNVDLVHDFLVRWILFDTYTTGLGAGVSAFSNVRADWGVIIPASLIPGVGTYKLGINIAAAGVVADNNACYLAQQFRGTQADGNGPFDNAISSVFNAGADVTIGSSANQFWYDNDPVPDGIYDETEIDNLGDGNFANFLLTIQAAGHQDSITPFSYTYVRGSEVSGDLSTFLFVDQSYDIGKGGITLNSGEYPIEVQVEGLAASTSANSIRFTVNCAAFQGGGNQRIELFNFATNKYEIFDQRAASNTDTSYDVFVTSNASNYISSTRHVRAMVAFNLLGFNSGGARSRIDFTGWTITRP